MPAPPRFCPFCRESFDDAELCPDHGLPLVPFEELPGMARRTPGEGEAVAPYDPRFGRGVVFVGVALAVVAMALPFVARDGVEVSLLGLATTRATNLWTVPCVTAAQLAIVLRRRTLESMRAARAVLPALSLLSLASVGYTLHRVHAGAEQLVATYGVGVQLEVGVGAWLVVIGSLVIAVGGVVLGRAPR